MRTVKELANLHKHSVDFVTAAKAFKDPKRKIYIDSKHSRKEERFFCIGKVGDRILTARFIYRQRKDQDNWCWRLEKGETIL